VEREGEEGRGGWREERERGTSEKSALPFLNPAPPSLAWRETKHSNTSPLSPHSGYTGTSDQYIDRNIQFALAAARTLVTAGVLPSARILVPDAIELRRAQKLFSAALVPGVSLGHLREASPSGLEAFARAFGGGRGGGNAKPPPAGAYLVVNASTIELPDVEAYVTSLSAPAEEGGPPVPAAEVPAMVLWNMELDTLRADLGERLEKEEEEEEREGGGGAGARSLISLISHLSHLTYNLLPIPFSLSLSTVGLFGFPGKDLQYRFLCRFTPAFYIRPRDYSKTVPTPPFLINYSGALFRSYPGPWQVMLKQDDGGYACVAEDRLRYTLGEAKDEMAGAMGIGDEVMVGKSTTGGSGSGRGGGGGSGVEEQQSQGDRVRTLLTRGVRQSTWWEDAFEEEEAHDWRR